MALATRTGGVTLALGDQFKPRLLQGWYAWPQKIDVVARSLHPQGWLTTTYWLDDVAMFR